MPIFRVHLSETFRYLYSYSGERLNFLESQLRLTMVLGFLALLKYPTRSILCLFLVCTSLRFSGISTVSQGEGLNSFGVSAQADIGIRISAITLNTLPEVIVPISGVHLSEIFRYFYC